MKDYLAKSIKGLRACISVMRITSQNAAYCSTNEPYRGHPGPQGLDLVPVILIILCIAAYSIIRYTYGHREIYEVMTKKIQSHSVEEN